MSSPAAIDVDRTAVLARRAAHHVLDMCAGPEGGHLGGSLSIVDILTVLYWDVLRVDPAVPDHPDRDIFLLSKGHAAIGLYAVLAERGFFPVAELGSFGRRGGRLMGHPVPAVPGVELPTGSLGHGLALGLGFAIGMSLSGTSRRAFVLLGDGELQEGSCWEAAMAAAARRADNLVAIVDRNGLQLTGATEAICALEPLSDKWRSFGWAVREVDGHDHAALRDALHHTPWRPGRPSVVLARTTKGRGVSSAAGRVAGHYTTLNPRTLARAHQELRAATVPR